MSHGILNRLHRYSVGLCMIVMSYMLAITFIQVVLRYVFRAPIPWAEETTLLMMGYFAFFGIAIEVYDDNSIALKGLYNRFTPSVQFVVRGIQRLFVLLLGGLLAYYGWRFVAFNFRTRLPASGISLGILYAPMLLGGILMLVFGTVHAVRHFRRLSSILHDAEDSKQ